jgi:hypothetical protein
MQSQSKSLILRITALALFFLAAVVFLSQRSVLSDLFGVLAAAAGISVARLSSTQPESLKMRQFRQAWALKPWLFVVGVALIVPVAISLAWMFREAANRYKGSAFPLYMFAVSAVFCGAWWAAIFARWLQRPRI